MSPNDVLLYAKHISSPANGTALWNPHPGYTRDHEGRLIGLNPQVRPGDIGYLEEDGSFTRFFNIHLQKDDNNQGGGPYPEDFEPLPLDPNNITWRPEPPITYHSHRQFKFHGGISLGAVPAAPIGGGISFTFERTAGAILGFFDPGACEISQKFPYQKFLAKHKSKWLEVIESAKPGARTFQLVTGCTFVRSWVMGVVENEKVDGDLKLSIGFAPDSLANLDVSCNVKWENLGSSTARYGPPERLNNQQIVDNVRNRPLVSSQWSETDSANLIRDWSDQCIFVRAFHIKRQKQILNIKKMKAAAEPQDPEMDRKPEKDVVLGNIQYGEEQGEDNETPYDPIDVALDYILENSDIEFAVVHDDDLLAYAKDTNYDTVDELLQICHPKVFVEKIEGVIVGFFNAEADQPSWTEMPAHAVTHAVTHAYDDNATGEHDASGNLPSYKDSKDSLDSQPVVESFGPHNFVSAYHFTIRGGTSTTVGSSQHSNDPEGEENRSTADGTNVSIESAVSREVETLEVAQLRQCVRKLLADPGEEDLPGLEDALVNGGWDRETLVESVWDDIKDVYEGWKAPSFVRLRKICREWDA
ncbi:hypothetical protein C8J55DRAFT_549554 [Lentinula edodes]|uniref:Uncharacterized protein n=1 Tax=Lentinula lateritia TaxID=40482 RepID=A0A9W9DNW3_9AGAR|nr:hypothetical protein C8J55DRAFT_549554 [Lentinula edodes]